MLNNLKIIETENENEKNINEIVHKKPAKKLVEEETFEDIKQSKISEIALKNEDSENQIILNKVINLYLFFKKLKLNLLKFE